jgi:REP element-mobilizing transposase RayT
MVIEVTCRTVHGRPLLHPSLRLNRLAIGVLARAQRRYDMHIHAFCFMSNHYHLLLTARDASQLARFMNFVQSNLAREAGRLAGWRERFWGRRYQAIPVSDEAAAQMLRLRYILTQGCKEGLVARPELWRGAQCVRQLVNGEHELTGKWVDRTRLYRAKLKDPKATIGDFTSDETLTLTALPCFDGIAATDQRAWIRGCVEEICLEARAQAIKRRRTRARAATSRRSSSEVQPLRRSPAPWFHAVSGLADQELHLIYAEFVALFRAAAEKLKRGVDAVFPAGCFPPAGPYVAMASAGA